MLSGPPPWTAGPECPQSAAVLPAGGSRLRGAGPIRGPYSRPHPRPLCPPHTYAYRTAHLPRTAVHTQIPPPRRVSPTAPVPTFS